MSKLTTSITPTQAAKFDKEAEYRATKFCRRIPGLHLLKLKKRSSWRYRYTDEGGIRRIATIGPYPKLEPKHAVAKLGELGDDPLREKKARRAAIRQDEVEQEARRMGTYLEGLYWDRHQSRRKSGKATIARIRSNFGHLENRDMASLNENDVRRWQQSKEDEGSMAHATMRRELTALKTMLNKAVSDHVIERNPLADVKLLPPANDERRAKQLQKRRAARRLLTDNEIKRLHAGLEAFAEQLREQRRNSRAHGKPHLPDLDKVQIPHWFIPFCHVALYTGMRPGDIYALRWEEVSLDFAKITKVCEKTRHHPEPPEISVDLAASLLATLKEWHRQHGRPMTGLVFASPVNGERMDKDAHRRPWARVKALGELPDDLVFYALRHHFISTLVAQGVPILTVARLVGQKSATMIERHYGHLSPDSARNAIDALAESLSPQSAKNG